jgi:hypothetical protein
MKPETLAALREEVEKIAGRSVYDVMGEDIGQQKRNELVTAEKHEQAYSAAQQEYGQGQADIERFKKGTEKLAKAVEEATAFFTKAIEAERATKGEIGKLEATHGVNVAGAGDIKGVEDKALIEGAGGFYNPANQTVLDKARGLGGAGQDNDYFNQLSAVAHSEGKDKMFAAVLAAMKNADDNDEKRWALLAALIKDLQGKKQSASWGNQLPGS